MAFKVKIFPGAVDYEALHVAKLTNFPLEKRDYKPYSQARVCFAKDGMHVQLLAFEARPLPESRMAAVFDLTPLYSSSALLLELFADGRHSAGLDFAGARAALDEVAAHTFTGEDLQGVYWGGNLVVPRATLERAFPNLVVAAGQAFTGNLYKTCENPERPHYGSFYPADFNLPPTAPANLGEFLMIDY